MSLTVKAYSGARGSVVSSGWRPTSAAFILAALIAMYKDQFGWPQIEEFKRLNDIEDWEPYEDLSADGVLVAEDGKIYLPDGFNLDGWADYYNAWKSGAVIARLPEVPEASYAIIDDEEESEPAFVPENIGWQPTAQTVTPQTTVATNATAASSVAASAPKPQKTAATAGGVPGWVWLAGAAGVAVLLASQKKPSRGKRK